MEHRLDDGQIEVMDDAVAEVLRRKAPAAVSVASPALLGAAGGVAFSSSNRPTRRDSP